MQLLPNTHISPETAYVVEDYPYGFRLRCAMRYWIEYRPRMGFRLVTQSSNPKRAGLVWNKPKAGTYHKFGLALYLDDANGHVHAAGLNEYSSAYEACKYVSDYYPAVPEAGQHLTSEWAQAKLAYTTKQAEAGNIAAKDELAKIQSEFVGVSF